MISHSQLMIKHGRNLTLAIIILLMVSASVRAESRKRQISSRPQTGQSQSDSARTKSREDLIKTQEEFKASLRDLLGLREGFYQKAQERLDKLQALYTEGAISRLEIEKYERALALARAELDQVREQIKEADVLVAQSLVEYDADEQLAASAFVPTKPGGLSANPTSLRVPVYRSNASYIRFSSDGNWSLRDAAKVESFFTGAFARPLPVSAFGQTQLHNRMGFDHRSAMDVALHPESPEGQALMKYLRERGIPFIAFRSAVPRSATGPHIHIGRPSHRILKFSSQTEMSCSKSKPCTTGRLQRVV